MSPMATLEAVSIRICCKIHHQIPFFLALRLSVRQFQMPLVKTLATLGIINATDSLKQNITRIVCLR